MGIYFGQAGTERLPTMARLWSTHGGPPLDLVWGRERQGPSPGCVLHLTHFDVHLELRSGRLGNT